MKDEVSFADFARLDLRIGEITAAKEVDGSGKLVELVVSFGGFSRTVYAGIKKWYLPEVLVGRKLIFVVNLPAKKFTIGERECVSEGMLLAADGAEGEAVLYSFDKDVSLGATIR